MEEESINPWAVGNLEEFLYFCCPECNERSQSEDSFLKHAFENHPKSKSCLLIFTSQSSEVFETDSLDKEMPIKNEMISDEEEVQDNDETGKIETEVKPELSEIPTQEDEGLENDLQCHICWKEYSSIGNLNQHLKNIHQIAKPKIKKEKYVRIRAVPKERICRVCDGQFPNIKLLTDHISTEHGEENYACNVCGKVFEKYVNLSMHKMNVHVDERNFQCDKCEKNYKNQTALSDHKKRDHDKIRFPCNKCGKVFKYKQACDVHVRKIHEGENLNVHQCNICGKSFDSNYYLKTHIATVHTKENIFKCDLCDYKGHSEKRVRCHKKFVHTMERNFVCKDCGNAFKTRLQLTHHVDAVHKGIRKFECKLCDRSYAHAEGLRRHMSSFHAGIRYECQHCTKSFTQENHLKSHYESAHGEKYIYTKSET